jgi:hypothetical protein
LVIAFYSSIINRLFREHWTHSASNPTLTPQPSTDGRYPWLRHLTLMIS